MSNAIRIAVFALTLSAFPAAAQAQAAQSLLCRLIPALCEQPAAPSAPSAVPELDGSAASNAVSLLVGAALILGARRRRAA